MLDPGISEHKYAQHLPMIPSKFELSRRSFVEMVIEVRVLKVEKYFH